MTKHFWNSHFQPGDRYRYEQEEQQALRNQTNSRKQRDELGVTNEVLPFTNKDYEATYYQVAVGQFGVRLPEVTNIDTLDGLQLIQGKGTRINNVKFAQRIAQSTGGVVMIVTEQFVRRVEQIDPQASKLPNAQVTGEEPLDIKRGLGL